MTSSLTVEFQSEVGKHIPRLSKHRADLVGLHLPLMKVRILLRKLTFLAKLVGNEEVLEYFVYTLSSDNAYKLVLSTNVNGLRMS